MTSERRSATPRRRSTSASFRFLPPGEVPRRRVLVATSCATDEGAGHDAVHVGDLDLLGAPDIDVMAAARETGRTVVSADTDFGELLAIGRHPGPSFVLLRRAPHLPHEQAELLLAALGRFEGDLDAGAVVVLSRDRARVRRLPIA